MSDDEHVDVDWTVDSMIEANDWRCSTRSLDGRYRYRLTHGWPPFGASHDGGVCWIMLNPSTATHERDDATMRAVRRFTRREGYAMLDVVNLYALRSPDPGVLVTLAKAGVDVVGPDNAEHVAAAIEQAALIVCAWGANVDRIERHVRSTSGSSLVADALEASSAERYCLGLTRAGHPRHPCRLSPSTPLQPYPG